MTLILFCSAGLSFWCSFSVKLVTASHCPKSFGAILDMPCHSAQRLSLSDLDGGGASTFCIVIPAMLPVYKRMHMRPTTLLRIAVLAMGVLNLMPWAGPTMRAASVLGMEAGALWKTILPIQIFGPAFQPQRPISFLSQSGLGNGETQAIVQTSQV